MRIAIFISLYCSNSSDRIELLPILQGTLTRLHAQNKEYFEEISELHKTNLEYLERILELTQENRRLSTELFDLKQTLFESRV